MPNIYATNGKIDRATVSIVSLREELETGPANARPVRQVVIQRRRRSAQEWWRHVLLVGGIPVNQQVSWLLSSDATSRLDSDKPVKASGPSSA